MLLAILVLMPGRIQAEKWNPVLSLDLKEEYDDNIYLEENKEEDFITTISPAFSLGAESERFKAGIAARLDGAIYRKNDDFNAIDQSYRAWCNYGFTPRFDLGLSGGYRRDYQPDRDIEETGLALGNERREQWDLSLSANYLLSEKGLVEFSYGYRNDAYQESQNSDVESHNVAITFSRLVTEFTRGQARFGYASYLFPESKVESYSFMLGGRYTLGDTLSLNALAGARYTISELEVPVFYWVPPGFVAVAMRDETSREWGFVGNLTFSYQGLLTSSHLTLSHDVAAASGYSGTTERTALVFGLQRRLTFHWSAGFSAGYYVNKSTDEEFSSNSIDEKSFRIDPSIRYRFTEHLHAEARYSYFRIEDNDDDQELERNYFLIRFVLQHPFFG